MFGNDEFTNPVTCGVAVGEVDEQRVAALRHRRPDRDIDRAVPVVVEDRLAAVDAVGPGADARPRLPLRAVENLVHALGDDVGAVLVEQTTEAPRAQMRRPDRRPEIAEELARVPHVRRDHPEHVVARRAAVVQQERRHAEPFLPDLRGRGVVAAVRRAADVAVVRAVDRPEREAVAGEHRHEHGKVGQVVAAEIRIVQQVDVAGADAARERVEHGPDRPRERADVDRDVLGLRHEPARAVAQRGGKIPAAVQDLGVRRAEHGFAHLRDDRHAPVLNHRDGDAVGHTTPPVRRSDHERA